MKNLKTLVVTFVFSVIGLNVIAQSKPYPFQVKVSGHGKQSLIFIPGFACSGEVWKETLSLYESTYTCYTLTMAGFAGLAAQGEPSFNNWEFAIIDYIKEKHIDKPIIIGHSLGGGLALAIAADDPGLPLQIVVVDALPCLSAIGNPVFKSAPNNDCSAIVNRFAAMNDTDFKIMQQKTIPQLLADTGKLNAVVSWSVLSDRTTFATMYCDFMNTDLRDKIANVTCPVLVMLEAQFMGLKPVIEAQYKKLKSVQLNYATKGRHFIMYDDREWYIHELSAFIK